MSTSAEHAGALAESVERRFYARLVPSAPIYIAFDKNNQGILLNIGENGLLVSTPFGLPRNFVCRVSVGLNGLPKAIQVNIRVVWTTESNKRAGIQLLDLCEHDREQIRKWAALERLRDAAVAQSDSHEPARPSQGQTEHLPAIAAPSERTGSAPNVPSPEPGICANAFSEPATSQRASTGPLAEVHFREAPGRGAQGRVSVPRLRRNTPSKRLSQGMWVAVIAVLLSLGLLFLRGGPLPALRNRSGEAAADSNVAAITDVDSTAKRFPDDRVPVPIARSEKSAGDAQDTMDVEQRKNIGAVGPPDSAPNTPIQNVPSKEDAVPKAGLISSSKTPEQLSKIVEPAISGSEATESAATHRPAPNPTENDTASDFPVADDAAATGLAVVTAPASSPPHSNDRPMNAPPESVSNPIAPTGGAAYSLANRPSSLERQSSASEIYSKVPEARVTEIKPPKSSKASFVDLPGARVLGSASITMHVQRSVLVPGGRKWLRWPLTRSSKDVLLGELVSRVDPETSQEQTGSGSAVSVRAIVDKGGRIANVIPVSGSITFVPNVVRAVRQWRYEPTFLNGKPVETEAYILVEFHPTTSGTSSPQ